jgi:hypothetical protein
MYSQRISTHTAPPAAYAVRPKKEGEGEISASVWMPSKIKKQIQMIIPKWMAAYHAKKEKKRRITPERTNEQ